MSEGSALVERVLSALSLVQQLREKCASDDSLGRRVLAIKRFQQRRFEHTYADLLASPRYKAAAAFFLEELYGPDDHALRDAQFAKVVPSIARIFPDNVVALVEDLVDLHALTEQLDHRMAGHLGNDMLDASTYCMAWVATGSADLRARQLSTVLSVGRQLDRLIQRRWLRQGLLLMRPAARAAGLASLQQFLESGLSAFTNMHGAEEFLQTIQRREKQQIDLLFGDISAAVGSLPT